MRPTRAGKVRPSLKQCTQMRCVLVATTGHELVCARIVAALPVYASLQPCCFTAPRHRIVVPHLHALLLQQARHQAPNVRRVAGQQPTPAHQAEMRARQKVALCHIGEGTSRELCDGRAERPC